jgi:hypothetical protein
LERTAILVSGGLADNLQAYDCPLFGEIITCDIVPVISSNPDAIRPSPGHRPRGLDAFVVDREVFTTARAS